MLQSVKSTLPKNNRVSKGHQYHHRSMCSSFSEEENKDSEKQKAQKRQVNKIVSLQASAKYEPVVHLTGWKQSSISSDFEKSNQLKLHSQISSPDQH